MWLCLSFEFWTQLNFFSHISVPLVGVIVSVSALNIKGVTGIQHLRATIFGCVDYLTGLRLSISRFGNLGVWISCKLRYVELSDFPEILKCA